MRNNTKSALKNLIPLLSCILTPSYCLAAKIGISQIVEHPALDDVRAGIEDALKTSKNNGGDAHTVTLKVAQGNMAINVQIAQQLAASSQDILIAISTPSAQALANATKSTKTPIIFAAVTDPVAAKLVDNVTKPGGHITGVSDQTPISEQIALIRQLCPDAKTIGILHNPAEVNSSKVTSDFEELAKKEGYAVKIHAVTQTADVITATKALIGKADLIYVPQDNTVVSAIDALIALQKEHKIPLITSDEALVKRGALAAVGTSYFKAGQMVGSIILRLLNGEKTEDIAVLFPENPEKYINITTLKSLGLDVEAKTLEAMHRFE